MSEIEQSKQALRRAAAGHRGCNRRVSWPPSLSLGRWAEVPRLR